MEVLDAARNAVREVFYGRLDLILEFNILDQQFWGPQFQGKTVLLAVITPCVDAPTNDLPSGKHTKTHTRACDGVTDS